MAVSAGLDETTTMRIVVGGQGAASIDHRQTKDTGLKMIRQVVDAHAAPGTVADRIVGGGFIKEAQSGCFEAFSKTK